MHWDESQAVVIEQPSHAKILVDAGPGTGKTAVACARVAYLIDHEHLEPSNIWLISFTRTAVREIRERIGSYLNRAADAFAVKIATLDSHAWAIHSGFDVQAKLTSYEENILKLTKLLGEHDDIGEYLETLEHLIIDEAQDIVGNRAELVVEIIRHLSPECGITVFADEAQAIYAFAADEDANVAAGDGAAPLPDVLREHFEGVFSEKHLQTVHRTKSATLRRIFTDTRQHVLEQTSDPARKLQDIRGEVSGLADGRVRDIANQQLAGLQDAFILYRRRVDVLLASSFLGLQPHRLRMSGLPARIAPWLGACLAGHTGPTLGRDEFEGLWAVACETTIQSVDPESAWQQLVRIAGHTKTTIDMARLRQRLGRGQPPAEICLPEVGDSGPIVGTIHSCKGREAEEVRLMLPPEPGEEADHEEEARVVFVGATRARVRLMVGTGYRQHASRLSGSGRTYSLKTCDNKARAQVEIGRENDITAAGVAGKEYFPTASDVHAAQTRLAKLHGQIVAAQALSDHNAGHVYRLRADDEVLPLCVLSERVNKDLFEIGKAVQSAVGGSKRRPPDELRHLRIFGIRTLVMSPDAPECELLHEPWRSSGIMLVPVVIGYTTIWFPAYQGRGGR